jgi:hypothetical protein
MLNASALRRGHDGNTGVMRLAALKQPNPLACRTDGWYTAGVLGTPVHIFCCHLSTLISSVGKDNKKKLL